LIAALALLLLVVALHLWLVWVGSLPGDHWALAQKEPPHSHIISAYSDFFQFLEPAIVIPLFAVAMFLLLRRNRRAEAVGLVIAYCAIPVNEAFKLALGPSPLWLAAHQTSHDYPSGLVAFTTAVFGFLGLLAWRHERRWISAIALVLILASGPARVVTGIHLVSDVIGGYLLGGAMLLLAWRASDRSRGREGIGDVR
jgi:undecaprenyl-diphosphatase